MHCLSTILVHLHHNRTPRSSSVFFFFVWLLKQANRSALAARHWRHDPGQSSSSSSRAVLQPHTHIFMSSPSCQCAQNCQTPLKAVDAMCNSFNTRPRRYPSHCCNGRAHATLHPASSREAAGNSFNLCKSTPQWIRERVVSRQPDTQQPSSFGGDLRVVCDSITGRENIIHDFLSAARGSTNVGRGAKRLDRNCGVQNWCMFPTLVSIKASFSSHHQNRDCLCLLST